MAGAGGGGGVLANKRIFLILYIADTQHISLLCPPYGDKKKTGVIPLFDFQPY